MRLHAIRAKSFMSLQAFSLDDIDPKMNIIVGPNGTGKSSIFRAVRALIEGTRCIGKSQPFEEARLLCAKPSATEEFEVALDIEFDAEWEQELIITYLCAAMTNPEDIRSAFSGVETSMSASEKGIALYASWLLWILRPEVVDFLFRGTLRFNFQHFVRDDMRLTYTFRIDDQPITISMSSLSSYNAVLSVGSLPTQLSGNNQALGWQLFHYLRSTGDFDELRETLVGNRLDTQILPGVLDMKKFVLSLVGANAVINVKTIPRYSSPYSGPHKLLHELAGREFDDQQSIFGFAELMYVLLSRGVIMTNNFRHPPERVYTYAASEVSGDNRGIYDDRQIPLRLFDLKNGGYAARKTYCDVRTTFKELVGGGLTFDVVASTNADKLVLEIRTAEENGVEIPIVYHGAGIWEALVLATLLNDNTGKVLLLDEPASNLHANMQRKFLGMLQRIQMQQGGPQAVLITHSQHLLPTQAKNLHRIRRLQRRDSSTVVFGLGKDSVISLDKLERDMRGSSDLAGLLFASGVILVEGGTETAAIDVWYPMRERSQGRTLTDDNIVLFSVDGKSSFPLHIQYLVEFGVPYAVICDVDALDPDNDDAIWAKLMELGKLNEKPTIREFLTLKQLAANRGVFTANTSLDETHGFEDIPEVKLFIDTYPARLPRSKPLKGRIIGHNIECPPTVEEVIQASLKWLDTYALQEVGQRAHLQEPTI